MPCKPASLAAKSTALRWLSLLSSGNAEGNDGFVLEFDNGLIEGLAVGVLATYVV